MHCDDEGRLTAVGKARGMKQALTELVNKMDELGTRPLEKQTVFICHADATYLDGSYAAFGQVVEGMDAVDKIASVKTGRNDRPLTEQKMKSVYFVAE